MAKRRETFIDDKTTDKLIEANIDFAKEPVDADGNPKEFEPVIIWDTAEPGLRLRIGRYASTWQWFSQSQDHGKRKHVFRTLGKFDAGGYLTGFNPKRNEGD